MGKKIASAPLASEIIPKFGHAETTDGAWFPIVGGRTLSAGKEAMKFNNEADARAAMWLWENQKEN